MIRFSLIICIFISGSILFVACSSQPKIEPEPELIGPYYGQTPPDTIPQLFAPGLISDGYANRDMAIHSNGDKFFYSIWLPTRKGVLMQVDKLDSVWQEPAVAPFSGKYSDIEPSFNHNGKRLYFSSNRPLKDGDPPKDYDIWYVELGDAGWTEPVNLGQPVNTQGNEFYPSITKDNTLYFTAPHKNSEGIFSSKIVDGKFNKPKHLSYAINSAHGEFNSLIAPDESFLIFSSFGREDGTGGGDLYISFKDNKGGWTKSVNMGELFNTPSLDYCPALSPDGQYLFFSSSRPSAQLAKQTLKTFEDIKNIHSNHGNGSDDIYWVKASVLERYRPK